VIVGLRQRRYLGLGARPGILSGCQVEIIVCGRVGQGREERATRGSERRRVRRGGADVGHDRIQFGRIVE